MRLTLNFLNLNLERFISALCGYDQFSGNVHAFTGTYWSKDAVRERDTHIRSLT